MDEKKPIKSNPLTSMPCFLGVSTQRERESMPRGSKYSLALPSPSQKLLEQGFPGIPLALERFLGYGVGCHADNR